MGQEFSNMCSCFDSQLEKEQEMQPSKLPDHQFQKEIPGFVYSEISSKLQPVTQAFIELINEGTEGYDKIIEKGTCKVFSKEAEDGYVLKYTWNVPCSPKDFMAFMDKIEARKVWDKNIESIQLIGQYNESETLLTTKYKKYLTFDPRETLTFSKSINIQGKLADITFSVESDLYPVKEKIVRVKLFVAGLYAEPIDQDEEGNITKVTCISHMDVGLPKALNNIARKFAGTTIPPLTSKIVSELKKQLENN